MWDDDDNKDVKSCRDAWLTVGGRGCVLEERHTHAPNSKNPDKSTCRTLFHVVYGTILS